MKAEDLKHSLLLDHSDDTIGQLSWNYIIAEVKCLELWQIRNGIDDCACSICLFNFKLIHL